MRGRTVTTMPWRPGYSVFLSGRFGQRVVELVRVLAVFDDDRHRARETHEVARSGVRDHGDQYLEVTAALHRALMQQYEGSLAAAQCPVDPLNRDVAARAFDAGLGGHHLPLARSFEIARELLVDGHTADRQPGYL